ncbi:MAG TPA: DnaJ domain-containing protein [Myxococcota bacterium]|nr:DnaJ domain-containing protein [Myxococcota bacterium]
MSSSPDSNTANAGARVDLPEAFQREVREFARALPTLDYYAVLGVERNAEPEDIRDAFFQRSKAYHPDRYFKKELGPYGELLNEVYKRIVAAHDVLRDPKLRGAYDRSLAPAPEVRTPKAPPAAPPVSRAPTSGRGASLRSRLGLQSPGLMLVGLQRQLEQSRARARKHYEAALAQKQSGDWARAAQLVELALAFDPREKQYHDELAEILPRANADRAAEVRRKAEMLLHGDHAGAAELLEEAAQLSPTDAELAHKLAALLLGLEGGLEKAALYVERALSLEEENLKFMKTAGEIYRKAGDTAKARKHLQKAWGLDPMDKEIRQALETL